MAKTKQSDEEQALAAQATQNDPSAGETTDAPLGYQQGGDPQEVGYIGASPARALAGGAADKGLSQQSILNG